MKTEVPQDSFASKQCLSHGLNGAHDRLPLSYDDFKNMTAVDCIEYFYETPLPL